MPHRRVLRIVLSSLVLSVIGCGDDTEPPTSSGSQADCGNGIVEGAESCDDGNTESGDGCSPTCAEETGDCGDGTLDAGEECDDGNTESGDGCSPTCAEETGDCGDGTVDDGEQCDDGNTEGGDGCSASCQAEDTPVCGDGMVVVGEECDDGNAVPLDGCEPDCTASADDILCEQLPPLQSGVCEVSSGSGALLIRGTVLAPHTVLRGGQVAIDDAGEILCVGCDCEAEVAGATEVTCPDGIVSPGLINAHDHITFTHNDPYTDTGERYEHRHDWRRGNNGHTEISASGGASKDRIRWGELRFLMGGATSTVGSGSATGFLRNLDRDDQEGLGEKPVLYDTFPLGDSGGLVLDGSCAYPDIETAQTIAVEDAYFPHVSEGIDRSARNEFLCVSTEDHGGEDLLESQSAFIHSVGLTPVDYARMAFEGTSLIWSPRSNVTLYGDTAVVTAAHRLDVDIALGTDWSRTGSMNMLRELRCADSLNADHYDGYFSDRELWQMATVNAAKAADMHNRIGILAPGFEGDVAIFDGSVGADHRAIIDADPEHVTLVVRGGETLYGDDALVTALPTNGSCDALDVCGTGKRLCAEGDIGKSYAALASSAGGIYPTHFCGVPDDEPSCLPTRPVSVAGSTVYSGIGTAGDQDGDGIADGQDNCPAVFNPVRPLDAGLQADFDLDGDGDACDVCPLNAAETTCTGYDPSDTDLDGEPNASDNCPDTPNPAQSDGDNDDKGDACDPCPLVSNPGDAACPVSIYAIKSGLATGDVAVLNALVTGCADGNGFFLQVKPGDPDYVGADHSGVFVYDPAVACGGAAPTVQVGDRVTLTKATVADFFGQIQLNAPTVVVDASLGEAPPAPVVVSPAQAGGDMATPLESVIVEVQNLVVTDDAPAPGPGDQAPTNEFEVDGVLRVNDLLHQVSPIPTVGSVFSSLTGILDYRNGYSKLEPRGPSDVVFGAPLLIGFEPTPTFAREGATGTTFPDPLTVTLSAPAQGDTFVGITSNSGSLTVAGGGATIMDGDLSATVDVTGVSPAASVLLTASLAPVVLNANVRVLGANEAPVIQAVEPADAFVTPGGMLGLEVVLDIPAPPGGSNVALSVVGEGLVPGLVTVPVNQLRAPFTYTAGQTEQLNQVVATLGGVASANVTVSAGGALVINEVDYDQDGTDGDEFVEIYNGTASGVDLTDLALVLMNGANDTEYDRIDLAPAGVLAADQYLVVGSSTLLATLPPQALSIVFGAASNNIQNGAPDALAILDMTTGELLDALSYEGAVTMGAVNGVGALTFVEGTMLPVAVQDTNSGAGALIRFPNGVDSDDAASDWAFTTSPTPGLANAP